MGKTFLPLKFLFVVRQHYNFSILSKNYGIKIVNSALDVLNLCVLTQTLHYLVQGVIPITSAEKYVVVY